MPDLYGGFLAALGQTVSWKSTQAPIAKDAFLSPQIPQPRPWERVAVTPAAGHTRRQAKIWKRVTAPPTSSSANSYASAMTELESQGCGSRKRVRDTRHVPVYGDGKFHHSVNDICDGKWDLVEARSAVAAANLAEKRTTTPHQLEPTSKWVPRKRHSTRWPIEPKMSKTKRMVADLQPLIEFDLPVVAEDPADVKQEANSNDMSRRSTRRLSRRISIGPGLENASPRSKILLPTITLSPSTTNTLGVSPVKKTSAMHSPMTESPLRNFMRNSFTANTTPTKTVLEEGKMVLASPKNSPAAFSPLKASSPQVSVPQSPVFDCKIVLESPKNTPTDATSPLKCSPIQTLSPQPAVVSPTIVFELPQDTTEAALSPFKSPSPQPAVANPTIVVDSPKSIQAPVLSPSTSSSPQVIVAGPEMVPDSPKDTPSDASSPLKPPSPQAAVVNSNIVLESPKNTPENVQSPFKFSPQTSVVNSNIVLQSPENVMADAMSALKSSPQASVVGSKIVLESPVDTPANALSPFKSSQAPAVETSKAVLEDCKFILNAPKNTQTITSSPFKSSPPSGPVAESIARINRKRKASEPLVFDQPTPSVVSEAPHEARRRVSLESARRNDRRLSGVPRLFTMPDVEHSPASGRRHSFTSTSVESVRLSAEERRKTLDAFFASPDKVWLAVTPLTPLALQMEAEAAAAAAEDSDNSVAGEQETADTSAALESFSPVVIDVGTNLDIFGPPAKKRRTLGASGLSGEVAATPVVKAAPRISSPVRLDAFFSSPENNGVLRATDATAHASVEVHQAEVSPASDASDGDEPVSGESESVFSSPSSAPTEETADVGMEGLEYDSELPAHDPEGLSTIYEESFVFEGQTPQKDSTVAAPLAPSLVPSAAPSPCPSPALALAPVSPAPLSPAPALSSALPLSPSPAPCSVPSLAPSLPPPVPATPSPKSGVPSAASSALALASAGCVAGTEGATGVELGVSGDEMSSGFTPINGRQISPPSVATSEVASAHEDELEFEQGGDDGGDEVDDDLTLNVVEPAQAPQEDSETEMLRKFVTRVAADKNAKAAAAAAAIAKKTAPRGARRSGSTGSTTSSTGSPMAKSETPQKRTPLGERSANSPSPLKKRKLGEVSMGKEDEPTEAEEVVDAPKLKRRRKRAADDELETKGEGGADARPEIDAASSATGPRRSTRSRSTRIPLKPTAPSANSIAQSMIPLQIHGLAGRSMMDDTTMDSQLARNSRNEDKDLLAITRVNTRKNKANSVFPSVILAKQAQDPSWKRKELKSVFDAKESRAADAGEEGASDGRKTRKTKTVRWAEELVRFQTDEATAAPSAFKAMSSSLLADVMMEDADEDNELAGQPEQQKSSWKKPEAKTAEMEEPSSAKKPVARRTRSSKLQPPTPVKLSKGDKVSAVPVPAALAKASTKAAATAAEKAAAASASTAMATRRSKIAKLGSGNGTPAPKRRGRPPSSG
ncbi:hypothetical protein B0H63DRAFT_560531 [Podospora didyma]|uniref:Uncharacterized protein n=1 Tax=Podospora didyma TaxID=330526 RepID=A0AAE0NQX6_9PEZI|nr:hypothetical protein B0H63DRAFT_560531 [Podospora didyma]